MIISRPVDRSPHWLTLKQTHRLDIVLSGGRGGGGLKINKITPEGVEFMNLGIECESVVDSSRKDNHVPLDYLDPDPLVSLITDIKVAAAVQNETNLLVGMKVLLKEHLDLCTLEWKICNNIIKVKITLSS
jgi:hypothetical protein